jgi:hypothetical protein
MSSYLLHFIYIKANDLHTYIPTTHALSPKSQHSHLRYSSEMPVLYHNYSAMSNAADETGGKPIAV